MHHRRFKALHARTPWTYWHIWYGRSLIVLAVINGGLGLQLANNTTGGKILYIVVAGVIGVAYCAVVLNLPRDLRSARKIFHTGHELDTA